MARGRAESNPGGAGGEGVGGAGGSGGNGGAGQGGGIFNGGGATLTSTITLAISTNAATGGSAGTGGAGGIGIGGIGGQGGPTSGKPDNIGGAGGAGGHAVGGTGGPAGASGVGAGGGLFNDVEGKVIYRAGSATKTAVASTFTGNRATGGSATSIQGSAGGSATGGAGGSGGIHARGGTGGSVNGDPVSGGVPPRGRSAQAAPGATRANGTGGGLFNAGTASFTGVTVDVSSNQAVSGTGGTGGSATGGVSAGSGIVGITTTGGSATGGNGGDSGVGASGLGGGFFNATKATLTLKPRLGAAKGSRQAKATDVITTNKALAATGGQPGAGGSATGGLGTGSAGVNGVTGVATPGQPGASELFSRRAPGDAGIVNLGTAAVDNTTISGNQASTSDPNVDGNLTS